MRHPEGLPAHGIIFYAADRDEWVTPNPTTPAARAMLHERVWREEASQEFLVSTIAAAVRASLAAVNTKPASADADLGSVVAQLSREVNELRREIGDIKRAMGTGGGIAALDQFVTVLRATRQEESSDASIESDVSPEVMDMLFPLREDEDESP